MLASGVILYHIINSAVCVCVHAHTCVCAHVSVSVGIKRRVWKSKWQKGSLSNENYYSEEKEKAGKADMVRASDSLGHRSNVADLPSLRQAPQHRQ